MKYDIYRCAPASTLKVVTYLRALGIRAWAPQLLIRKRLPRQKKRVTVTKAAIPGYVFIPQFEVRLHSLNRPAWAALRPLWASTGTQAACSESELTQMQELINTAHGNVPAPAASPGVEAQRGEAPSYGHLVDTLVRIKVGPFAGFGGRVSAIDEEGTATIDLKNSLGDLKISACLLEPL